MKANDSTGLMDRQDACPTGSTGFQPVKYFQIYKRNLPHWQSPGSVYFITFRTFKNITLSEDARDVVLNSILFWKGKKFSLYGAIVMPDHAHLILQPLEKKGTDKMSVPPNKTGSTGFQPVTSYYSLAEILHSIKSYSASKVNKLLGESGSLWLDENFDRIVRDEGELLEKMNYITNNPVKVGLVNKAVEYKWLYLEGMQKNSK
ncbi:MAG: hypothetical protein Q8P28_07625 [Deltaproteobacteria bacterium]|nr:hypothetical protein [Deltaproteobacteria bacterium]